MRKFEFPLDKVLRVKRHHEKQAELRQQKAQDALDAARAELRALRDNLDRVSDRLARAVGVPLSPYEWATAFEQSDRLDREIRAAEPRVAAAEREFQAARAARRQVATEVEAMTTMRAERLADWRQEAAAADQERLDEVGLRRWLQAQDAPTPDAEAAA